MHPAIDGRTLLDPVVNYSSLRCFCQCHENARALWSRALAHFFSMKNSLYFFELVDADKSTRLMLPQARIQAAMGEQFGMGAGFGDMAFFQDHQAIHARDG